MDIRGQRKALAAAAKAVVLPDLIPPLTVSAFVPGQVTAPMFFVAEYDIEYDKTFGGDDAIDYTCRVLVGRGDDQAAEEVLDQMLQRGGPASLKTAIEVARGAPGEAALGGLADDLRVVRTQGNRLYEHAGVQYLGAELIVHVIGDGD